MAFATFINDPKSYLRTHEMQLNGAGGVLIPAQIARMPPVINPAGSFSVRFNHVGVHSLTQGAGTVATNRRQSLMRRLPGTARRQIVYVPAAGGPSPGFRLLPWEATNVSFMELGAGANFAVTGPLTGCTVGVGRHPVTGNVWFFHANVAGGGGALLLPVKQAKIQNAGNLVGFGAAPPAGTYTWCEMTNHYNGLAFVWGRLRGGGVWKFYVHDINPVPGGANQVTNVKWAEL